LQVLPLEPLRAGTAYETRLDRTCGRTSAAWRAAERVVRLEVSEASPGGTSAAVPVAPALDPWLLRLEGYGAERIELLLTHVGADGQDACVPTTVLAGGVEVGGRFVARASRGHVGVGPLHLAVRDLEVSGRVDALGGTF